MNPTEWQCCVCTFLNSPENKECGACSSSQSSDGTEWQCTHCTMFNRKDRRDCITCDHPRVGMGSAVGSESQYTIQQTYTKSPHGVGSNVDLESLNAVPHGYARSAHDAGPQTFHGFSSVSVAVQETARCETDPQGLGATFSSPCDEASGGDDEVAWCGSGDTAADPTQEEKWVCKVCSTLNRGDIYRCSNCNGTKPYIQPSTSKAQMLKRPTNEVQQTVPVHSPCDDSSVDGQRPPSLRQKRVFDSNPLEVADILDQFHLDRYSQDPVIGGGFDAHPPVQEKVYSTSNEEVIEFPDSECRIMLVGKTGHGKSATANTILGVSQFETSPRFHSTTKKCQRHSKQRFGIHLEVMDTPGLFDTELSVEDTMTEIARCLGIIAPGPHAVVVVIRIGIKFTEEEAKAVEKVYSVFGVQLLRHLVIVFTYGDSLSGDDAEKSRSLTEMLDSSPEALRKLLKNANNRYVVFSNKPDTSDSVKAEQVRKLILTIKQLLKVNGGRPYTSPLLEKVEKNVLKREAAVCDEYYGHKGNQTPDRKRQAREIVRDELAAAQDHKTALLREILKDIMPIIKPVLTTFLQIMVKKAEASGYCSIL